MEFKKHYNYSTHMNWVDFKSLVCEPNAIGMFCYSISIVKKEILPFWSTFQTWCNLFSHCLSICTVTWLMWKIQLRYPLPNEWDTYLHVNEYIIKWHVRRVFPTWSPICATHARLWYLHCLSTTFQVFSHQSLRACFPWIFPMYLSTFLSMFPSTRIARNSETCGNN